MAETGWPSAGEDWEVGVGADLASDYNMNAIRHLGSGVGTPLMPNRTFEVTIFSLFDENLKPGPVSEHHFGLFHADMTPVYDIGILTAPESVGPVSAKREKMVTSKVRFGISGGVPEMVGQLHAIGLVGCVRKRPKYPLGVYRSSSKRGLIPPREHFEFAEQHHYRDLREACIEFIASRNMLGAVMATDGFNHLVISCPHLLKEILGKVSQGD